MRAVLIVQVSFVFDSRHSCAAPANRCWDKETFPFVAGLGDMNTGLRLLFPNRSVEARGIKLQTMCFSARVPQKHIGGGLTLFPCLGPEFVAALLERSAKKAEGSKMRRPRKRYEAFYKLTAALKRVWEKISG
jgi:hypothetical protein